MVQHKSTEPRDIGYQPTSELVRFSQLQTLSYLKATRRVPAVPYSLEVFHDSDPCLKEAIADWRSPSGVRIRQI